MPTPVVLRDYTERLSKLSDDSQIGWILWFTIPSEFRMRHDAFVKLARDYGLDKYPGVIPNEPQGLDVFHRALKENERSSEQDARGNTHNFLIRPHRDHHQVVREQAAPRGRKLTYKVLANIKFDRPTEVIISEPVDEDPWSWKADEIADSVRTYYRVWRHCISDSAVRYFLRGLFQMWGATCVRPSGGVYFVLPAYRQELGALAALIEEAATDQSSRTALDVLPIPNDEKQKAMIRQAFEDESLGESERLLGEISEILQNPDRRIREGTWEQFHVRFLMLTRKTTEYGSLLEGTLDRVTSTLEILRTFMMPLADRVGSAS